MSVRAIFLIAISFICISANAFAEKRVALVIGNSAYASAGRLANPANDAADVAAALGRLGFDVTRAADLDARDFAAAIDNFLSAAHGADVAIFYYAGHGLQYDGGSYLLPVDARLENEFAIRRETMGAQEIVSALEGAARASVVILDACRNNPLAERLRDRLQGRGRAAAVARGLGRIEASSGNTLVVYSAAPGQEAKDGAGRNSPFTEALLKYVETPGLEMEQMLKRVTADVERETGGKQQPERLSRLKIELMLKGGAAVKPGQTSDDALAYSQARLRALEEELQRQRAEAERRQDKQTAQMQALIVTIEEERQRQRSETERRDREALEKERQQAEQRERLAAQSSQNVCGWYAIRFCSKIYQEAASSAARFNGFIIDTNDRKYPNFARGWYCSATGPMAKADAATEAAISKNAGFPSAYIKNPC